MTPYEKAHDLLGIYMNLTTSNIYAKQSAIICVEQIIEQLDQLRKPEYTTFIIDYNTQECMDVYEKKEYWQEVLSHLKNS